MVDKTGSLVCQILLPAEGLKGSTLNILQQHAPTCNCASIAWPCQGHFWDKVRIVFLEGSWGVPVPDSRIAFDNNAKKWSWKRFFVLVVSSCRGAPVLR